jgi:hypothetical protein
MAALGLTKWLQRRLLNFIVVTPQCAFKIGFKDKFFIAFLREATYEGIFIAFMNLKYVSEMTQIL